MRKIPTTKKKMHVLSIRVDDELYKKMIQAAMRRNTSLSQLGHLIIKENLDTLINRHKDSYGNTNN